MFPVGLEASVPEWLSVGGRLLLSGFFLYVIVGMFTK